jgi:hypothetical protein
LEKQLCCWCFWMLLKCNSCPMAFLMMNDDASFALDGLFTWSLINCFFFLKSAKCVFWVNEKQGFLVDYVGCYWFRMMLEWWKITMPGFLLEVWTVLGNG